MKIEHAGQVYEFDDSVTPEVATYHLYLQNPKSFENEDQAKLKQVLDSGIAQVDAYEQEQKASNEVTDVFKATGRSIANAFKAGAAGLANANTQLAADLGSIVGPMSAMGPGAIPTPSGKVDEKVLEKDKESTKQLVNNLLDMDVDYKPLPERYVIDHASDILNPVKTIPAVANAIATTGMVAANSAVNPLLGLNMAFSMEFQNAYEQARQAGHSIDEASNRGMAAASINAIPEMLMSEAVFGKALKWTGAKVASTEGASPVMKGLKNAFNRLVEGKSSTLSTAFLEGATEGIQDMNSSLIATGKPLSFNDWAISTALGAISGGATHATASRMKGRDASKVIDQDLIKELRKAGEYQYLNDFFNKDDIGYEDIAAFVEEGKNKIAEKGKFSPEQRAELDNRFTAPTIETFDTNDFDIVAKDEKTREATWAEFDPVLYNLLKQNKEDNSLAKKLTKGEVSLEQVYRTIFDVSEGKVDTAQTASQGRLVELISRKDRDLLQHGLWSGQLISNLAGLSVFETNTTNQLTSNMPFNMIKTMYAATRAYREMAPNAKQAEGAVQAAIEATQLLLFKQAQDAGFSTTYEYVNSLYDQGKELTIRQLEQTALTSVTDSFTKTAEEVVNKVYPGKNVPVFIDSSNHVIETATLRDLTTASQALEQIPGVLRDAEGVPIQFYVEEEDKDRPGTIINEGQQKDRPSVFAKFKQVLDLTKPLDQTVTEQILNYASVAQGKAVTMADLLTLDPKVIAKMTDALGYDAIKTPDGYIVPNKRSLVAHKTVIFNGQKLDLFGKKAEIADPLKSGDRGAYYRPFTYDMVDGRHIVLLNSNKAGADTILHEFGHYLMHKLDPNSREMKAIEWAVHHYLYPNDTAKGSKAPKHRVKQFADWTYDMDEKRPETLHHEAAAILFEHYFMYETFADKMLMSEDVQNAFMQLKLEMRRLWNMGAEVKDVRDPNAKAVFDWAFARPGIRVEHGVDGIEELNAEFGDTNFAKILAEETKVNEASPLDSGVDTSTPAAVETSLEADTKVRRGSITVGIKFKSEGEKRLFFLKEELKDKSPVEQQAIVTEVMKQMQIPDMTVAKAKELSKNYIAYCRKHVQEYISATSKWMDKKNKRSGEARQSVIESPPFTDSQRVRIARGSALSQKVHGTNINERAVPIEISNAMLRDEYTNPAAHRQPSDAEVLSMAKRIFGSKTILPEVIRKAQVTEADGLSVVERTVLGLVFVNESERVKKFMDRKDRYAVQQVKAYQEGIMQLQSKSASAAGKALRMFGVLYKDIEVNIQRLLSRQGLPKAVRRALMQMDLVTLTEVQQGGFKTAQDLLAALNNVKDFSHMSEWKIRVIEAAANQYANSEREAIMSMQAAITILNNKEIVKSLMSAYTLGGALSNPEGRVRDIKSNLAVLFYKAFGEKLGQVAVDKFESTITKKDRDHYLREMWVNPFKAIKPALRDTKEVLKGLPYQNDKTRIRDLGKQTGSLINTIIKYGGPKEKLVGYAVNTSANVIRAIDTFARILGEDIYKQQFMHKMAGWQKDGILDAKLTEMAEKVLGDELGNSPIERRQKIEALKANPILLMEGGMSEFADAVSAQQPSQLAEYATRIRDSIDDRVMDIVPIPVFKMVSGTAFITTPLNLMKFGLKLNPIALNAASMLVDPTTFSPFPLLGAWIQYHEGKVNGKSGREILRAIAVNNMIGSTITLALAAMMQSGKLTGPPPEDDKERALLGNGWQPFSFVWEFGGEKQYCSIIEPFSWVVKPVLSQLYYLMDRKNFAKADGSIDEDKYRKQFYDTQFLVVKNLVNNSMFGEMARMSNYGLGDMPSRAFSSLMPYTGLMRFINNAMYGDETIPYYDTAIKTEDLQNPKAAMVSKAVTFGYGRHFSKMLGEMIPGFEYDIPEKITLDGNVVGRDRMTMEIAGNKLPVEWFPIPMFDKISPVKEFDPVELEFQNLEVYPSIIGKEHAGIRGTKWELTTEEQQQINFDYGRMIKAELGKVINTASYQAMSIENKQKLIDGRLNMYKRLAMSKLLSNAKIQKRRVDAFKEVYAK